MAPLTQTKKVGKPFGAPGIAVYETAGINQIPDPLFGTTVGLGPLKRGPEDVLVPVRTFKQYQDLYGDPNDPRWHLFEKSEHLFADFVEDFFRTSNASGTLFVCRLGLEGKSRPAELTLRNRLGTESLRIRAANGGRWGGIGNVIPATPVVVATVRTFTLVTPNALANEYVGAEAEFTGVPGKRYRISGNSDADPRSGETVFTVGAQYNLIADGVSGPAALSGTATYTTKRDLTGTIAFALTRALTGTCNINGRVVTGDGTAFSTEAIVGQNLYRDGEARVIESVTSDTTLTVSAPFSNDGTGLTLQTDNLQVVGTGTTFTSDLAVDQEIFVDINGEPEGRTVAAIASDTELVLTSGFTDAVGAGTTAQVENLQIAGTGTAFNTQLQVGSYLVDPNRSGATVRVTAIPSATSVTIDHPFSADFTDAKLTKQSQLGSVRLEGSIGQGLAVEVGQGVKNPDTHFSLKIYFNGNQVMFVADASLDPADPDFVERVVDQQNLVYSSGDRDFYSWIRAESLWSSDYTTAPGSDVRPCNGAGSILELTRSRLFTVAPLNYQAIAGQFLYPDPYQYPRSYFRVQNAVAPVTLSGTVSSTGVTVTGTSTTFRSSLRAGDYLYDPNTRTVRKIRSIASDTTLTLETAFPTNMPALTKALKSGYLQVNEAYDLTAQTEVGNNFLVVYPESLTGGYDGNLAGIIPFHYSKHANPDINFIEKATINQNMGLVRIVTPGVDSEAIQKEFLSYAEQKSYEVRCEIPSYITTAAAAEAYVLQRLGRSNSAVVAFPSYGYKSSPYGAGYRMVSLSGMICGGEARRASANRGWHYPYAGPEATLPGVLKLPFAAQPADEAILNLAGIQPILFLDGNAVVMGARAPSSEEVYKFAHIGRIQKHYTRVLLESRNLISLLFLPNQPGVTDQILLMLDQFARREYDNKVLTNYLSFRQAAEIRGSTSAGNVLNDSDSESSLVAIINGELVIDFRFTPTGIVEVIRVNLGPSILVSEYGNTL